MSDITVVEASFNEIQSMYDAGELDKESYVNLLEGLRVEEALTLNAEELYRKEQLNQYVNAAIRAASLLA